MYTSITNFLTDWTYESQSTLNLFKKLSDDKLKDQVHPNVRSLGFMSWHIIHTLQEMLAKTGLNIDIKHQQDYAGESVKELCDTYERGAKLVAEAIKANWTDTDLEKEDNMYGEMWKRGVTLSILVKHQAHHRAEMVVVMRILGLPVIGAYGPTKEEWTQFGMPQMN
ncbi:MAG: DinB family protein [Bacteroidetes bacterium]|nr:DinB family protein [Bacteroidota bacterium]